MKRTKHSRIDKISETFSQTQSLKIINNDAEFLGKRNEYPCISNCSKMKLDNM